MSSSSNAAPALLVACCLSACTKFPMVGEINGHTKVTNVVVDDDDFGESGSAPGVLEIVLDERSPSPGNVGRKVKQRFFPDEGKLIFNVAFSCGHPCPCRGLYADPTSIWFNVFFGYYQLDVPRSSWQRPFGYETATGSRPAVRVLDIVRIGKADWNYFSNYMYGVPESVIERYNHIDPTKVAFQDLGRVRIGATYWDHIVVSGVEVVSAYVSGQDGQRLVANDEILTPVWQELFGPSEPSSHFPISFIPTHMKAEIYMAFSEGPDKDLGERAYSTLIFGATINTDYPRPDDNQAFLEAQLKSIRQVIESDYAHSGFASPE